MKYSFVRITIVLLVLLWVVFAPSRLASQTQAPSPVVVSVRMEKRSLVYKVNGKTVEDSKENSLIANLARIVRVRGEKVPVFIIVDVRAPFTEVGKLETALDKVELTRS